MNTEEVKQYLEKELPEFTYITSELEANENKIWIERDGQKLVLDVSKVGNKKEAKKLKSFIELKWREVELHEGVQYDCKVL
jgi:hypothetical protein